MAVSESSRIWRAIGLMSGTSLDGVDAALIETDGETVSAFGPSRTVPYEPALRTALRQAYTAGGASDCLDFDAAEVARAPARLLEERLQRHRGGQGGALGV